MSRPYRHRLAVVCGGLVPLLLAGCVAEPEPPPAEPRPAKSSITSLVYQLQDYRGGSLDALAAARHQLAIVDLARDAGAGYFSAAEVGELKRSGKVVLAYFELGSLEAFRPDYESFRGDNPELFLNEWDTWPGEFFVKYWDERWWDRIVRPRVDRAIEAGFDGVYLDTPLAYEEIDLDLVPAENRDSLATKMVRLIERTSDYAKQRKPGFWIVPQNSPELRHFPGYVDAIDGIGMEELFFLATDEPCDKDFCAANLNDARALRDAGKLVLATDYATRAENVAEACRRYREEGFVGYVTVRALDQIRQPCP